MCLPKTNTPASEVHALLFYLWKRTWTVASISGLKVCTTSPNTLMVYIKYPNMKKEQ